MKCIKCKKVAQYIYFGASFCEEHYNKHVERVKEVDLGKPVEGPSDKLCPKCLEFSRFTHNTNCDECGSQLAEWDLICECGAKIQSFFKYGMFGRKPIPVGKYCTHCGRDITKLAKSKIKEIRSKYSK